MASEQFHAKLLTESGHYGVPFYIAVPSRQEAETYVRRVGFLESSVREWKDLNVRVTGTPTIVAVDSAGLVKGIWVGMLSPYDESLLLKAVETGSLPVTSSGSLRDVPNYSSKDLEALQRKQKISVVDTHERGFPGTRHDAIVMPLMEVPFRASAELDRNALQLVDCSNLMQGQCEHSAQSLLDGGFQVATLDAGVYHQNCSATTVR